MMQKMYYYTSTETMQKIIQNGNIWATNLAYMNDAREVKNGLIEVKEILQDKSAVKQWLKQIFEHDKEKIEIFDNIDIKSRFTEERIKELVDMSSKYTISFCKKKDLLSQWIAYAKESGVCIEMQFDLEKETNFKFYENNPDVKKRNITQTRKPEEILYYTNMSDMSEQEKEKTRREILKRIFEDGEITEESLEKKWIEISTYVKHYDFYQEQEYRIAFETEGWDSFRIGYRLDKHILKPYLDVECENGWPITMIMVGPGFNQQVVYDSIKFYLNHEEINSSALCGIELWKNRLRSYIEAASKKCGESVQKNNVLNWINDLVEDNVKDISSRADIQKHIISFMKESGKEYEKYFEKHYFTVSGIVLEKSDIPYIY